MSFVEQHGLWSAAQADAARAMEAAIAQFSLEVVRFGFADQHGIVRGKTLVAREAIKALRNGVRMVNTLLLKDTANKTVWPVFTQGGGFGTKDFEGAADIVLVPDPTTFRVLPWAEKTGWVQCEAMFPDGRPVPFDTRGVLRRALATLDQRGYALTTGLEVEFHVFRITNARNALADSGWPPEPIEFELIDRGYQMLAEQRYDGVAPILDILRRDIVALGLPVKSVEVELGPSQCEFVFDVGRGMESADHMILFRNAAKQIMKRQGYHVTFMCRPKIPNVMSSGWHLHQSLADKKTGANLFVTDHPMKEANHAGAYLSALGTQYLGGLIANTPGSAVFATPTINGYRRYARQMALAPDRVIWGHDNRGALLRVVGGPGEPATRIENRIGEPAANPYLYMASQIYAGLDGIDRKLDPGPAAHTPYEAHAPMLPTTLEHAVAALRESACMRRGFGDAFVDYYAKIKEFELARFNAEVSDWEQREYFDFY
jgi:glutamine synthetase